jgi:hypothetical protein
MVDRTVQFGEFLGALNDDEAKNAQTPSEYIDAIANYDLINLRSYYTRTSDEKYKKIEKGLQHRIQSRRNQGKALTRNDTSSSRTRTNVSSLGNNLNEMSSNNSDIRRSMNAASSSSSTVVINQQNTVAGNATQQQNRDVVDDSSPYSRKIRA